MRQDKTIQSNPRSDNTGQSNIRHVMPIQDKTGRYNIRQDNARQNRTRQDAPTQSNPIHDKTI